MGSRRGRWVAVVAVLLLLSLVSVSCGDDDETSSTTSGETTVTTGPANETHTLTIAIPGDIPTFNPSESFFQISNEYNFNVNDNFFDYGTKAGATGVPTYDPTVITGRSIDSWVVADDGMSVDIHVREGATFHRTGNPVTADDVIWFLDAGMNTPEGNWFGALGLTKVASWEKLGTYDVRIHFSEPSAFFFYMFRSQEMAPLDSVDIMAHATEADPYGLDYIAEVRDVGSGPYMLVNYVPGSEAELAAFPDYWGPDPYFDRVILKVVTSEADRVLLLQQGAVDIATSLGQDALATLRDSEGVQVLSVPDRNSVEIAFNVTKPPFDNKSLRQAVGYAIPYEEIVGQVYGGNASLPGGVVARLGQDADPSTYPYTFDQAQARALLEEGGFADGFAFTVHYEEGNPTLEQALVFIQTKLAEVGIDLSLQKDPSAAFATVQSSLTEDAFAREILWYVDDVGYIGNWVGLSTSPILKTGFANERVDELVGLMQVPVTTPEERAQKTEWAGEFQEIMNDELPNLYICDLNYQIAMRSDISGYKQQADDLLRWELLQGA